MHQDPWEPSDGSYPAERKPNSDANDPEPPADGELGRVRSPFLNWHVVEIEGEATLIEETEIKETGPESVSVKAPVLPQPVAPEQGGLRLPGIQELYDDVVVAGMQIRRVTAMPGETATFEVTIANHGKWSALFEVALEGWIDEAWTPDLPLRIQLEAGARQVVILPVVLPRQADCRAGEHALAVVVRAARYPGHVTRMAAVLVVDRFASLKVGALQPSEVDLSWFVSSATVRLPITNQSNYATLVHLQGVDADRQCDFTFYVDGSYVGSSTLDEGSIGTARLTLQPGQSVAVPVEIRTRQRQWIGVVPRMTAFRLIARVETDPPLRRAAEGQVAVGALIGPWHLLITAVLGIIAVFGTGLAGLALLVALRSSSSSNYTTQEVATAPPPAPVVAFVIQMDQPMPTREPNAPSANVPVQPVARSDADATNSVPEVPIVSADQVTAPGEPTPVGQLQLRPLVVTTPVAQGSTAPTPDVAAEGASDAVPRTTGPSSSQANLTYGQMFKDVAARYDLDWRLLAAQAYLESGFDSLALSGDGYMGLMQVHPATWNEWAPTVDASDPFDAYSNVLVGALYLDYLRTELSERGFAQQEWMLVAYNWGPEKVFNHLDAGGTWETLDPDRRQYAEDILRIAATIPAS